MIIHLQNKYKAMIYEIFKRLHGKKGKYMMIILIGIYSPQWSKEGNYGDDGFIGLLMTSWRSQSSIYYTDIYDFPTP